MLRQVKFYGGIFFSQDSKFLDQRVKKEEEYIQNTQYIFIIFKTRINTIIFIKTHMWKKFLCRYAFKSSDLRKIYYFQTTENF